MTEPIFFDGWFWLLRVIIVGVLAFAVLIFMLRTSGKRTLSTLNAFDLVVSVALGSTFATVHPSDRMTLSAVGSVVPETDGSMSVVAPGPTV